MTPVSSIRPFARWAERPVSNAALNFSSFSLQMKLLLLRSYLSQPRLIFAKYIVNFPKMFIYNKNVKTYKNFASF
jgi:hypothetical protein